MWGNPHLENLCKHGKSEFWEFRGLGFQRSILSRERRERPIEISYNCFQCFGHLVPRDHQARRGVTILIGVIISCPRRRNFSVGVRSKVWSPDDPLWHSLGVPLPHPDNKWTNAAVTGRRAWWPWPQTLPEWAKYSCQILDLKFFVCNSFPIS